MKTNKLVVAALALFVSVGAYAQTVDEIVDKHVAAMGGMDKLSAVKTVAREQSIAVQGMEIPVKSIVVVGKSMRSESSIMGNSMIQVVDGGKGWKVVPAMMQGTGEPEDMTAEELKQQSGQLDPFGALVNYKSKGSKVELVGKEKVGKADAYHLKVTTKDGQTIDQYLDANTYLVSKVKMIANGQEGEILLSDYKDTEGVKFANTMEMESPQAGTLTFVTNKITINGPVDETVFKKPTK